MLLLFLAVTCEIAAIYCRARARARDYEFRIQGSFTKPLNRQVDEAVRLGEIDRHGRVLDDVGGPWGGPVISLNSRGEYYRPRIMQYNFEN